MALTNALLPYIGPLGVALALFAYCTSQGSLKSSLSYARVRHRR